MSVYIKGMEMPTSCCECFAFKSNASGNLFCKAKCVAFGREDAEWLPKKTPNWCPLIPVPDHGRLIDADALLSQYKGNIWTAKTDYAEGLRDVIADVKAAPTIIPADEEE